MAMPGPATPGPPSCAPWAWAWAGVEFTELRWVGRRLALALARSIVFFFFFLYHSVQSNAEGTQQWCAGFLPS